jgi:hypothetical protein
MASTADAVQLKPETLRAFRKYSRDAETGMGESLHAAGTFLWTDLSPARAELVTRGKVVAEFWSGQGPVKAPNGLIHDWIGAAFVSGATVAGAVALVQDYNNHKSIYKPDVIDSTLISRHGDDFKIRLRLLKKKVITVVLDTYHDVHYVCIDQNRWFCRSHTTRICEVENAGSAEERVLLPDTGHGFLWRLYSYWRFEEKSEGVYIECRAISLTRDIPFGLGWLIEPIIQNLPRESLVNTLEATRLALCR